MSELVNVKTRKLRNILRDYGDCGAHKMSTDEIIDLDDYNDPTRRQARSRQTSHDEDQIERARRVEIYAIDVQEGRDIRFPSRPPEPTKRQYWQDVRA